MFRCLDGWKDNVDFDKTNKRQLRQQKPQDKKREEEQLDKKSMNKKCWDRLTPAVLPVP